MIINTLNYVIRKISNLIPAVSVLLTVAGQAPKVLTATAILGAESATAFFESAYDEHARRLAALYAPL